MLEIHNFWEMIMKKYCIKSLDWKPRGDGKALESRIGDYHFVVSPYFEAFASGCFKEGSSEMIRISHCDSLEEGKRDCEEFLKEEVEPYLSDSSKVKIEDLNFGENIINGWMIMKGYNNKNEIVYSVRISKKLTKISKPVIVGLLEDIQAEYN